MKNIKIYSYHNATDQVLGRMLKEYIDVLPFVFLYVAGEIIINSTLDFIHHFRGFSSFIFIYCATHIFYFFCCFILLLHAYRQLEEYQEVDYYEIIKNTLYRLVPALVPILVLSLFTFMMTVLSYIIFLILISSLGFPWEVGIAAVYIAACIFGVCLLLLSPLTFVATYRIAIEGKSIKSSISSSMTLLENYKFKSMYIIFILIFAKVLLSIGIYCITSFDASDYTNFLFFPLIACMVITVSRQLDKKDNNLS